MTDYVAHEGFEIHGSLVLETEDNLEVAAHDPMALIKDVKRFDTKGVDVVVLSWSVQMPSLHAFAAVEATLGIPVTSAGACTVRAMFMQIKLEPVASAAGAILAPALRPGALR
ncbi:hypothetical protein [Tateyamaria pelophila]|uniref:hypothetical protein n=1 Tax=Tateyamaria pelophila TaxID=328415 RepID=UPI001CBCD7EC|nr:hypothetical protein [Tateyamaria pelophila]